MQLSPFLAAVLLEAVLAAPPARAAETILFETDTAHECSLAALGGDRSDGALAACNAALSAAPLSAKERAGTLINRAVIHMARNSWDMSRRDLDAAMALAPDMGEIYVNRAAQLIHDGHSAAAVKEVDRGLQLGAREPEKAYYNRALALENLNDVRGAYFDYRKAAEINPKWPEAQLALSRFKVAPRAGGSR